MPKAKGSSEYKEGGKCKITYVQFCSSGRHGISTAARGEAVTSPFTSARSHYTDPCLPIRKLRIMIEGPKPIGSIGVGGWSIKSALILRTNSTSVSLIPAGPSESITGPPAQLGGKDCPRLPSHRSALLQSPCTGLDLGICRPVRRDCQSAGPWFLGLDLHNDFWSHCTFQFFRLLRQSRAKVPVSPLRSVHHKKPPPAPPHR